MYAVKRSVYQGSDGVQVDQISQVKEFTEFEEAERIAANCGGRVVRIIKGRRPKKTLGKHNQQWMRR